MLKTVLIVDDNQANRELLKLILLHANYHVLEAINGMEAIQQAKTHQPDIILMDIQLPVMDGTKAIRLLQSDEATANIPVVAFTSYAMKGDKEKLLALGFNGYIAKPINIDEVIELLKKY